MTDLTPSETSAVEAELTISRRARALSFAWVAGVTAALLTLAWLVRGPAWAGGLLLVAAATVTVLGKFAVFLAFASGEQFWGVTLPAYSPWVLGGLVCYLDITTAVLMTFEFDLMCRLPVIGSKIASARIQGASFLRANPWFRKYAFLGMVGFVFFPVTGTGAIVGTVIGNLLGMRRGNLVLAIALGGALGGFGFAAGAVFFEERFQAWMEHPALRIAGWVVLAAVAAWFALAVRRRLVAPRGGAGDRAGVV